MKCCEHGIKVLKCTVTRGLVKNRQSFQKIAPKVTKSKKAQYIYYKAQFESPNHIKSSQNHIKPLLKP
jgi:hypothetical protein